MLLYRLYIRQNSATLKNRLCTDIPCSEANMYAIYTYTSRPTQEKATVSKIHSKIHIYLRTNNGYSNA